MNKLAHGFSIIELVTVLAISSILLVATVPMGSFWLDSARISTTDGEMSHGIGKAIAIALRNEQALDNAEPAAALCLSDTNQLTVLQATATDTPNCDTAKGTSVWTSAIPDDINITDGGNDVECFCFTPYGLPTNNSCSSCTVATTVDMEIGNRLEVLHVR